MTQSVSNVQQYSLPAERDNFDDFVDFCKGINFNDVFEDKIVYKELLELVYYHTQSDYIEIEEFSRLWTMHALRTDSPCKICKGKGFSNMCHWCDISAVSREPVLLVSGYKEKLTTIWIDGLIDTKEHCDLLFSAGVQNVNWANFVDLHKTGPRFMRYASHLVRLDVPNLREFGYNSLAHARAMFDINAPKLKKAGINCHPLVYDVIQKNQENHK